MALDEELRTRGGTDRGLGEEEAWPRKTTGSWIGVRRNPVPPEMRRACALGGRRTEVGGSRTSGRDPCGKSGTGKFLTRVRAREVTDRGPAKPARPGPGTRDNGLESGKSPRVPQASKRRASTPPKAPDLGLWAKRETEVGRARGARTGPTTGPWTGVWRSPHVPQGSTQRARTPEGPRRGAERQRGREASSRRGARGTEGDGPGSRGTSASRRGPCAEPVSPRSEERIPFFPGCAKRVCSEQGGKQPRSEDRTRPADNQAESQAPEGDGSRASQASEAWPRKKTTGPKKWGYGRRERRTETRSRRGLARYDARGLDRCKKEPARPTREAQSVCAQSKVDQGQGESLTPDQGPKRRAKKELRTKVERDPLVEPPN